MNTIVSPCILTPQVTLMIIHPSVSHCPNHWPDPFNAAQLSVQRVSEFPELLMNHQPDSSVFCPVNAVLHSFVRGSTWRSTVATTRNCSSVGICQVSVPSRAGTHPKVTVTYLCHSAWPTPSGVTEKWDGGPACKMPRAVISFTSIVFLLKGGLLL